LIVTVPMLTVAEVDRVVPVSIAPVMVESFDVPVAPVLPITPLPSKSMPDAVSAAAEEVTAEEPSAPLPT